MIKRNLTSQSYHSKTECYRGRNSRRGYMDNLTNSRHKGAMSSSSSKKMLNTHQSDRKIKILVVEDNFLTQCVIEQMLTTLGYCADFAEDGKTALALYSSNYPLILMDIELPDFNGIEVTKVIRRIEEKQQYPNIPIIAITSNHDDPEYRKQCFSAGMNGCFNKPNLAQLKQWISEYAVHQHVN